MDFSIRIKAWRLYLGKTQKDFGAMCGADQTTVSSWECGLTAPTLGETWRIVTTVLGVTWARFWSSMPKARRSAKASAGARA
jgi:transcriptional regulator with XRE-family HTH domain